MDDDSYDQVALLLIDDPSNFSFHAAYMAYSAAWKNTPDEDARRKLNEIMQSLVERKDGYSVFYEKILQYRKKDSTSVSSRRRFTAKKKRAWRKSQAKQLRISRHKK